MSGQLAGYMILNGEKVLVLCRISGWKRYFKIRKSGQDGVHFEDEQNYILEDSEKLARFLKTGKICVE